MTMVTKGPKLLILGRQGSGKGTQGARIARHLGVVHLSTGDILRHAVEANTPLGHQVAGLLTSGELVPDDVVLALVGERLQESDVVRRGFLLDGFPRTVVQAEGLLAALAPEGVDAAIELDLSMELATQRLAARDRIDDTPEAITRRLDLYAAQTVPVHNLFERLGLLLTVDGDGSPDEVFDRIARVLIPVLWGSGRAVG